MSELPVGKITISRPTVGEVEEIVLSFTDEISRVQFLEFHISCNEFAKALTGLGYCPGTMELRGLHLLGMQHEHKTENIPYVQCDYSTRNEHARAILEKYEVDGWRAYDADYLNHHNFVRQKGGLEFQRVSFSRHVPAKKEQP